MGNTSQKVYNYNMVVQSSSTDPTIETLSPEEKHRLQPSAGPSEIVAVKPRPTNLSRPSSAMVNRNSEGSGKQRPKSAKARLTQMHGSNNNNNNSLARLPLSSIPNNSSKRNDTNPLSEDLVNSLSSIIRPNSKYPWLVQEWKVPAHFKAKDVQFRETLGHGYMGKVKLCFIKDQEEEKKYIAIKMINREDMVKHKGDRYIESEKHILKLLNNPSHRSSKLICSYFGCFEDKTTIYLCLEYIAGGTLARYLKKRTYLTQNEVLFYISNLVIIIEYLHSMGIVFRDLKPDNIMINENGYLKLIDFGLATSFYLDSKNIDKNKAHYIDTATNTRRLRTICGTPAYLSPEQLDSKLTKGYTYIVDYWALGIICYELCYGDTPFSKRNDDNSYEIFLRILQNKIHFPYRLFNPVHNQTKALISALCHADVEKRLCDMQDIKAHKFCTLPWEAVQESRVSSPYVPKINPPASNNNTSSKKTKE